jgi:hypothetical protein
VAEDREAANRRSWPYINRGSGTASTRTRPTATTQFAEIGPFCTMASFVVARSKAFLATAPAPAGQTTALAVRKLRES